MISIKRLMMLLSIPSYNGVPVIGCDSRAISITASVNMVYYPAIQFGRQIAASEQVEQYSVQTGGDIHFNILTVLAKTADGELFSCPQPNKFDVKKSEKVTMEIEIVDHYGVNSIMEISGPAEVVDCIVRQSFDLRG